MRHLLGLWTRNLGPALETLVGEDAVGLSATNIERLTAVCGMLGGVAAVSQAQPGWMPCVYVWAKGVRLGVGLKLTGQSFG